MEHYLEDVIKEFETQKCNIEYHKSLICKYCKDFINYIGSSGKANKQNFWKHYLEHEQSIKSYLNLSCGYNEERMLRSLENFSSHIQCE